jgi:hypothetical protein
MLSKLGKNMAAVLLIPSLILTGLSACATTKNQLQTNDNHEGTMTTETNLSNYPNAGKVKSVQNPYNQNYSAAVDGNRPLAYTEADVRSAIITAKRIAGVASKVPGVTRASAVAQGIDVVIGIDGNGKVPAQQLEKQVQQAAQKADSGYNIYVTADPTLHNKIRYMNTSMTNVRSSQVTKGISNVIYEIGRQSATK